MLGGQDVTEGNRFAELLDLADFVCGLAADHGVEELVFCYDALPWGGHVLGQRVILRRHQLFEL